MWRLIPTQRRRDRGAVAMVVTLLFSSGVFIGAAALTVDVGQTMGERRQLQNGADAAALSLAQTCGLSSASCTAAGGALGGASAGTTLLNDSNALDGKNGFDTRTYANGVCGRGTLLPACAAPNGTLVDCPPRPDYLTNDATIPFVEAHTLTRTASTGSVLPAVFSQALTGSSGGAVYACSRATWAIRW